MLHEQLQDIFRRVFDDDSLEINDDMDAEDIEIWDSLTHINLIVAVEKQFQIKLKNSEIARLQCVGDLKDVIVKHCPEMSR